MPKIILLGFELILLSFLSHIVVGRLYRFFIILFRHRSIGIPLITILLFPGTVIHELSHLFTAEILGVRTGKLTLVPEDIEEPEVRAGSVAIAETDPFRRSMIGLSPTFTGLAFLSLASYELQKIAPIAFSDSPDRSKYLVFSSLLSYCLVAISNTMFPSKEDLKGTPAFVITLALFFIALYSVGLRFSITGQVQNASQTIISALTQSLALVLAVNILLLIIINVLLVLTGRILKRSVV